jgi:hypothetical protein
MPTSAFQVAAPQHIRCNRVELPPDPIRRGRAFARPGQTVAPFRWSPSGQTQRGHPRRDGVHAHAPPGLAQVQSLWGTETVAQSLGREKW